MPKISDHSVTDYETMVDVTEISAKLTFFDFNQETTESNRTVFSPQTIYIDSIIVKDMYARRFVFYEVSILYPIWSSG